MIYICALCISVLMAECSKRESISVRKKIWAIVSGVPLFAISTLRYDVGSDYYYAYLKSYALNSTKFYFEPAFEMMYRIFKKANVHYQWIFIVSSLLIAVFVFLSIYDQSPLPSWSIFLYVTSTYYFISMNAVRQFVAMSICLYAMPCLKKRNGWIKYAVLVGIAALFHGSALIMLAMLIVNLIPLNKISLLIGSGLAILGLYTIHLCKPFLVLLPKYGAYFSSQFDENSFEIIYFGISMAVLVFALFFRKWSGTHPYYEIHVKSILLSVLILLYSAEIPLTKRIAWYFALPQIILIPIVLSTLPFAKIKNFFSVCIIGAYCVTCIVGIGMLNKQGCLPYHFFFPHSQAEVYKECLRRYGRIKKRKSKKGFIHDEMPEKMQRHLKMDFVKMELGIDENDF